MDGPPPGYPTIVGDRTLDVPGPPAPHGRGAHWAARVDQYLEDELTELKAELGDGSPERRAAELGDLLFACVNVARRLDADPELELRQATGRFVTRVEEAERLAAAEGRTWAELDLADQDRYFDLAKETTP